jgi:hypothetical protein
MQNPTYAEFALENHNNTFSYIRLKYLTQENSGLELMQPLIGYKYINLINLIVVGAASFYAIFLYKNRSQQVKIVAVSLIASIAAVGLLVMDYYLTKSSLSIGVIGATLNPHSMWMILAFLLNLLALKGIRNDQDKVSSKDSIR